MNTDSKDAVTSGNCGMCRKKIRMRDEVNLVLCTHLLDVVTSDRQPCEKYEECGEDTGKTYTRGF